MNSVEKALLDHAPDGVFWIRRDGSCAYVNRTACANLGYTREELLQRTIFEIDCEITPEFWRDHWKTSKFDEIRTLQRSHRRKDGTHIPVEVQIQQIKVDDEIVHFSFVRDLTREKQAEAQRESHISYLKALFEESPVPQLIIDPDTGAIMDANPAAVAFYGYNAKTLCSMRIQQINRMPAKEVQAEMDRARRRERNFFKFRHTDAGGEIHHVHVFAVPILRHGKSLLHSTILDVTEIVQSRHELMRFKQLVQRLPVGVYRATPGKDGIFLAANPEQCRIFDVDSECDLIGRKASDFYANPGERAEFSSRVEKTGLVTRSIHEAVTARGRRIWIAITSRWVELSDGQTVIEGAVEDITELRKTEIELKRAHVRAVNALQSAPIPMLLYTSSGRIEAVNQVWCDITGYTKEQLKSLDDWTALAYGDRADIVLKAINNMVRSGRRADEGDFRISCANGDERIWSFYSGPLEYEGDAPSLVLSAAIDVTEQRKHERQMRQAEGIIQSAREGITITGPDRTIERVNAAFTRITGYVEDEVRGKNPSLLSSGRQSASFYQKMWAEIDENDRWAGEIWNRRKNGEIYPEWLSITAIRNQDGELTNYAGVFTDLTELKRSQTDLARLQHFDPLTGLPNREMITRLVQDAMDAAQTGSKRLAVIICGLDRFRMVNASYSHTVGDRILASIAKRLSEISDRRTEVARLGGDQFVFVLRSGATRSAILDLIDKISALASLSLELDGLRPLHFSFTTGIARYPADGRTPEELLRNAEVAMFHAKKMHRGSHVFFSASQAAGAQDKLDLETELRQAIAEKAFDVHFQPVVSVSSNAIVGAEALARWSRRGKEMISPAQFIPMAEQAGLIDKLSFQLLESACTAAVRIQKGFSSDFRLAFNISPVQLGEEQFAERVADCLAGAGLAAANFELELTESTLMQQSGRSSRVLKKLGKSGIRLSIDDFGTGFSSLAYLQEIDADVLKIDRRFINDVATNPADAQIAASIIAMGHALDMDVIAEGVETAEQLAFLRRHECDYYQGYLFSKPLPLNEFEALFGN